MEINCRSYEILISDDEKTLFNVGGTVSIFDISGENAVELKCFNKLSNPSEIAISSDEKLIAYKNTSGHIAVHDIETGELLLKSKCLSEEGNDLFFTNNNKQIISSIWDGKVFILDIQSGKTTVISDFSISSMNIRPVSDNKFIVFGEQNQYTCIFEISITDKITSKKLCSTLPYCIEGKCAVISDTNIFFFSDIIGPNKLNDFKGYDKLMNAINSMDFDNCEDIYKISSMESEAFSNDYSENAIILFDFLTNRITPCFSIQNMMGRKLNLILDYGYFTSMCLSKDKRYLLVGFSCAIIGFDLIEKKHIGTTKVKYVSSLNFISSDAKVVIGSWNDIRIVDFQTLFS